MSKHTRLALIEAMCSPDTYEAMRELRSIALDRESEVLGARFRSETARAIERALAGSLGGEL